MKKHKLESLVEKLKEGKSEYFDEFYDLTKVSVYCVIKKVVNDNALVQDLMQETYIKFLNSLHKIDSNYNPFSYLLMIARNKAIDELRKSGRIDYVDFEDTLDNVTSININKIAVELTDDDNAVPNDFPLLKYCKEHLSSEDYKILEMTTLLGYRRVEVAEMLNIPKSTLNWRYNQILKKVKSFYKEVYSEKEV